VTLSWPHTTVDDQDLIAFVRSLADDWRGWSGARTWRSLDGDMLIDAHHDGRGHVSLGASLCHRPMFSDAWSARVVVGLEAGEQLSRLVTDLHILFADSPAGHAQH